MYSMSRLLIYMPALNEAKTIRNVISSIPSQFSNIVEASVLVVNDGSIDTTVAEVKKTKAHLISHNYNKGVGAAFHSAVQYALENDYDILISMDADGQFDANQIVDLVNPILHKEADFCLGTRFENKRPKNMSRIKFWGNKQVNKIIGFIGKEPIRDASCGFRSYSREALMSLNLQGNFTYTHETILDLLDKGFKVAQIPIKVRYFKGRESRVANNIFKYGVRTSKIIIKCLKDYAPFYFFINIAVFFFGIAAVLGGFVLVHWLTEGAITPYKSLGIFALSLLGFAFLVVILALLADILGRMRQNQEKILYFLKKTHYNNDH